MLLLLPAPAKPDPPEALPKPLFTLRGHSAAVLGVKFSPDGKRLATASSDKTAGIWDALTGKKVLTLRGLSDSLLNPLSFASDGKRLATLGDDQTVKVVDTATGRTILALPEQTAAVSGVAFDGAGRYLAAGGVTGKEVGEMRIWDARTGKQLPSFRDPDGWVMSIAYAPDGRRLASGRFGCGDVIVWEVASGPAALTLRGHKETVVSLTFAPEHQLSFKPFRCRQLSQAVNG
jgi:WD40 repeat protein